MYYIVSCIKIDKNYKTIDQNIADSIFVDKEKAKKEMLDLFVNDLVSLYKNEEKNL